MFNSLSFAASIAAFYFLYIFGVFTFIEFERTGSADERNSFTDLHKNFKQGIYLDVLLAGKKWESKSW